MPQGIYKRKQFSKEHLKNIKFGNIGKNKGRVHTKETKEKVKQGVLKWMKEHPDFKEKIRERMKGKQYNKGKHWKVKDTSKMRMSHIGRHWKVKDTSKNREAKMGNQYAKGCHHTNEAKEKNRKWHIEHPNKKFNNTLIEQKIAKELIKRGIHFQQNVGLSNIANVDFYLPEYKIAIQCDGDYWHNKLGAKEHDERQDKVLIFNGFNVYRFWEHEINKSAEECVNKIKI